MTTNSAPEFPAPGFSFENCRRNEQLTKRGFSKPQPIKTGTTIVGITYNDGVILGADTRATEHTTVGDKNCSKIHFLANNIYCCGAGTAADTVKTTSMIAAQLELHRLNTNRVVPIVTANQMIKQFLFRYHGNIGAALIVGGVDNSGPHLYSVYPHGSTDKLPYTTLGSGSLAAMAVFESSWKPDLTEEDGKKVARNAVASGIFNDLGSGSNVDLCVIRKGTVNYLRTYEEANKKGERQASYRYPPGTTSVLSTTMKNISVENVSVVRLIESMDH